MSHILGAESPQANSFTGGELVVQSLLEHKLERFYCVPGESYLAVIDALYGVREEIMQVTCRHESGAAMMALAEAELTQRPAVCFVTRGPGATNASIAMHMAEQASVPLVLCIGQVTSDFLGRESFQEMNYAEFFGGICKSVSEVKAAEEIPYVLREAFALAAAGRAGPVAIVFPEDVLQQTTSLPAYVQSRLSTPNPDLQAIGNSVERLIAAERPLIIAGGPLWADLAAAQLTKIAQSLRIPVVTAFRRNDVVDNYADCFAGYLGLNQAVTTKEVIKDADLILVLGPRLDEPTSNGYCLPTLHMPNGDAQWMHVYPDFSAITRPTKPSLQIELSPAAWLNM